MPDRSARHAWSSRPTFRNSRASRNQPLATPACWRTRRSSAAIACALSPVSLAACASSHNRAATFGWRRASAASRERAASDWPKRRKAWAATSSAGGRPGAFVSISSACAKASAGRVSSSLAARSTATFSAREGETGGCEAASMEAFTSFLVCTMNRILQLRNNRSDRRAGTVKLGC